MLYIYVIIFIVLYKYEQEKVIMIAYFGYQSCRETKSRLGHSYLTSLLREPEWTGYSPRKWQKWCGKPRVPYHPLGLWYLEENLWRSKFFCWNFPQRYTPDPYQLGSQNYIGRRIGTHSYHSFSQEQVLPNGNRCRESLPQRPARGGWIHHRHLSRSYRC